MLITACGKDIRKALVTAIVLSMALLRAVMAPGVRGARRRRWRATWSRWSRWLVWLVELIEILKNITHKDHCDCHSVMMGPPWS